MKSLFDKTAHKMAFRVHVKGLNLYIHKYQTHWNAELRCYKIFRVHTTLALIDLKMPHTLILLIDQKTLGIWGSELCLLLKSAASVKPSNLGPKF